jgi:undecaprenyl-diphosphatase
VNHLLRLDVLLSASLTAAPTTRHWGRASRIAHLGDGPFVFGLLLSIYVISWLFKLKSLRQAIHLALSGILATAAVVTGIKFVLRRQRPRDPAGFVSWSYDRYSFPSGHSARMAALAVSATCWHRGLGTGLSLLALAVALARVIVGVHFISDVLVGLGIGGLVTGLVGRLTGQRRGS